jgi:hypothetical protein
MIKSAAAGMRQIAEKRVAQYLRDVDPALAGANARDLVAIVFDTLREPDRDMAEAGRRELAHAVAPPSNGAAYERNLAAAVWRSMFAEAQR